MSYPNLHQHDSVDASNKLLNSFDGLSLEAGTRNCSSHLLPGFDRVLESILAITVRDGALFVGVKWEGSSSIEFVSVKSIGEKWPIKLLKYYESHLVFLENEKNTCGPVTQADVEAFVALMRPNTIEKYGIPTEIVDFLVSNGTLFIVVRWVERQTLGCIPAHIAYRKFPKMLISFYDSNVIWMCWITVFLITFLSFLNFRFCHLWIFISRHLQWILILFFKRLRQVGTQNFLSSSRWNSSTDKVYWRLDTFNTLRAHHHNGIPIAFQVFLPPSAKDKKTCFS